MSCRISAGLVFHRAQSSTYIGGETDTSTHCRGRETYQLNDSAGADLGWGRRRLCLSHIDGSNQMFLSFERHPGGHVCKKTAGVRALYQCITAALQFCLSLRRCSQLNLSGSSFELYTARGERACLRDILTASKTCIKEPCGRFI